MKKNEEYAYLCLVAERTSGHPRGCFPGPAVFDAVSVSLDLLKPELKTFRFVIGAVKNVYKYLLQPRAPLVARCGMSLADSVVELQEHSEAFSGLITHIYITKHKHIFLRSIVSIQGVIFGVNVGGHEQMPPRKQS